MNRYAPGPTGFPLSPDARAARTAIHAKLEGRGLRNQAVRQRARRLTFRVCECGGCRILVHSDRPAVRPSKLPQSLSLPAGSRNEKGRAPPRVSVTRTRIALSNSCSSFGGAQLLGYALPTAGVQTIGSPRAQGGEHGNCPVHRLRPGTHLRQSAGTQLLGLADSPLTRSNAERFAAVFGG